MNDMRKSDVIIIGGGLAGICAALELIERDYTVTLFDRDVAENFGGLAKESFGGIFVVGSPEQRRAKMQDSPERALADWHAFAEFHDDDVWPKRWAEAYVHRSLADVREWLSEGGVRFLPIPHWIERGEQRQGNSVPRFHIVWGTGRELALQLIRRLDSHPRRALLQLNFGHRVDKLIAGNGGVTGCRGVVENGNGDGGKPFEAEAGAVIVAAGGFNGNLDRVRANWHADWKSPPETILNGSHKYADGRMHDAVSALGGRLTNLDRMWNYAAGVHHWRPRKPNHGLSLVPPRSAIWANWRGERMMPPLVTGFDTRDLVTRVCSEERQYSWQILNRKIALKELAISGAEFNPSIREKKKLGFLRDVLLGNRWLYEEVVANCRDVVVAGTLPELVSKMNALQGDDAVKLEALERDIREYDRRIAEGRIDEDLQLKRIRDVRSYRGDKIRTCNLQPILDPKAAPLLAIREFIISRKSLGGIQTDLSGRVLDGAGQPIQGLYAAGEATGFGGGGMNGLRGLEGTFLGGCILSGRIAGRAIGGEDNP
jgi:predicted oxidoreductase